MHELNFSIKKVYKSSCANNAQVQWCRYVWNIYSIPKYRSIIWLAAQDRLKTKKRLKHIGVCDDDICYISMHQTEDLNDLLFETILSRRCIQEIMAWICIKRYGKNQNLMQLCRWLKDTYTRSGFRRQVGMTAIMATVYMV